MLVNKWLKNNKLKNKFKFLFYWNFIWKGQTLNMIPNYAKAKISMNDIFELLDREPLIKNDNEIVANNYNDFDKVIKFEDVEFTYPNREIKILDKLNLKIIA